MTFMSEPADAWVRLPPRDLLRKYGVKDHHGFIPAMAQLVAAHGRVAVQFGALSEAVMGSPGVLTRRDRELVAAVTAAAQDCFY